jgi:hypothetical protein
MAKLGICESCGGFVPASTCPNCGSAAKKLLALAAGATIAFTLMACYGRPPGTLQDDASPPSPARDGSK